MTTTIRPDNGSEPGAPEQDDILRHAYSPSKPEVEVRVAVGLTKEADNALRYLAHRNPGWNTADIVNRALLILDFIDRETVSFGKTLCLIKDKGEMERVHFL